MRLPVQIFSALSLFTVALPATTIAAKNSIQHSSKTTNSMLNAAIVADKFYIQPDNIYFLPNHIYVKIADDFIPIQQLSCDGNGIFIPISNIRAGCARRGTWTCENCGYENYDDINRCGVCGYQRQTKDY